MLMEGTGAVMMRGEIKTASTKVRIVFVSILKEVMFVQDLVVSMLEIIRGQSTRLDLGVSSIQMRKGVDIRVAKEGMKLTEEGQANVG
jgi:hypothetical protein